MMTPHLYVRPSQFSREEHVAAEAAGFVVVSNLADVPRGAFTVPRYSVLPFRVDVLREAAERRIDLATHGLSYERWFHYPQLVPHTPATYNALVGIPADAWPCIVKGRINSRKQNWARLMFAPDPQAGRVITERLLDDPLIAEQGIIYRQWEPFVVVEKREVGPDAIDEWRVFTFGGRVFALGYYWTGVDRPLPHAPQGLATFVETLAQSCRVGAFDFTCWDVGRREDGELRLIEINDGAMAGLSSINAEAFYNGLFEAIPF
jgi:hypothetical protein